MASPQKLATCSALRISGTRARLPRALSSRAPFLYERESLGLSLLLMFHFAREKSAPYPHRRRSLGVVSVRLLTTRRQSAHSQVRNVKVLLCGYAEGKYKLLTKGPAEFSAVLWALSATARITFRAHPF